MSEIYFTADTHFHHPRAAMEFRPFSSVEEHDEFIIDQWNEVVTKHDTVYHLGDVAMRRGGIALVSRLRGTKRLILGNHDMHSKDLMDAFKGKVYGSYILKDQGLLLTHIPVAESQLVFRFGFNVHGHIHDEAYSPVGAYLNVNTEQWDYRPIPLDEVLRRKYLNEQ